MRPTTDRPRRFRHRERATQAAPPTSCRTIPALRPAHAELHAAHARQLLRRPTAPAPPCSPPAPRSTSISTNADHCAAQPRQRKLTQTLRDQHPDTVRLLGGDTAPKLYQRLTDRLIHHDTAAVYLEASRVAGPADPVVPTWTLTADAPHFDAVRVTRVHKKHAYDVHFTVPNPEDPSAATRTGRSLQQAVRPHRTRIRPRQRPARRQMPARRLGPAPKAQKPQRR